MAGTKAKLPQSTIDGALGALALRTASAMVEAPEPVKVNQPGFQKVHLFRVLAERKKQKNRSLKNVHLAQLGLMVVLGVLSTRDELEQLKHDFDLADEEAYQVLTDLCGPPPKHLAKHEMHQKRKRRRRRGKKRRNKKRRNTMRRRTQTTKRKRKRKRKNKLR